MTSSLLRHTLRFIGQHVPIATQLSGKLGLGRALTRRQSLERITVDGDVVIELDLSIPIYRYIYFHHDLSDAPEVLIIRKLLQPGDVYVDVGAHLGYFALVAAKYAGRVIAFEPSEHTLNGLKRNLQLNPTLAPKITFYQLGLGDHIGQADLYNNVNHPGLASLQSIEQAAGSHTEHIALSTLDEMVADAAMDFLKIDVEGGELDVLKGGRRAIQRDQPFIFLELLTAHQHRFGRTVADVVSYLGALGYTGWRVRHEKSRLSLSPLDVAELASSEDGNVLFVSPVRAARFATADLARRS